MDAITAATTFSTLVSLVGQYRSERAGVKQADFNDFLRWLVESQHTELKGLVESNLKTSIGVKALLSEQQDVLIKKLECIDNALVSFASSFEGFSDLGQGLKPQAILSEQALSILHQFEISQASKILEVHYISDDLILMYIDGNGGQMEVPDRRFIQDDLKLLVELGLLRHEFNSSGDNLFIYTRRASMLVKEMKIEQPNFGAAS